MTTNLPPGTTEQLDLFRAFSTKPVKLFWWQWHGKQMFTELRNDIRFPRKIHRVVYHLSDALKAPDEHSAAQQFGELYPDAKTVGMTCIGEAK